MFAHRLRAFAISCCIVFAPAFSGNAWAQAPAADSSGAPAPAAPAAPESSEASPEPAKPKAATETPAVVVNDKAADTILGKPVESVKGEALGHIVDVIVDRTGMVRAAVIDFGGFLGVGTRKIAVDWHALHFPPQGGMDKLIADLPRDQLQAAPVYKAGEPIVILQASNSPSASPPSGTPASPPPDSTPPTPGDSKSSAPPALLDPSATKSAAPLTR